MRTSTRWCITLVGLLGFGWWCPLPRAFGVTIIAPPRGGLAPKCAIAFSPAVPAAGEVVTFNVYSLDPLGTVVSASWDFGDSATGAGLTVTHAYGSPWGYIITCTATDNIGLTTTCSTSIRITDPVIVSLPIAGWQVIAQPHYGDHALADIQVRRSSDGQILSFCEAALTGWVQSPLYWYDTQNLEYHRCGCESWDDDHTLRQGRGYWLCTFVDGLELIVP